jgi:hypothetical protein
MSLPVLIPYFFGGAGGGIVIPPFIDYGSSLRTTLRILYDNQWLRGTASASSTASASLSAALSQNFDRTAVWRSGTSTVDQWIEILLDAFAPVTCVAVANLRRHAGGSVVLQYWNGSAYVSVASLPAQDAGRRTSFAFFAQVAGTPTRWRLYFANTTMVSSYVEVGYVFIGTYFQPSSNVADPVDMQYHDPSIATFGVDGQQTVSVRSQYMVGSWQWELLGDADLLALDAIFQFVGAFTPIFFLLDATRIWTMWYAWLTAPMPRPTGKGINAHYNLGLPWREVR